MIYGLDNLTAEEVQQLLEAPVLITILIGDADEELDQYEIAWGEKIAKFRAAKGDKNVQDYYRHVESLFHDRLREKLNEYKEVALTPKYMVQKAQGELALLNPILKKLPREEAISLYESFKSFAYHIAKASGGFLSIGSIAPSEEQYLDLQMLENPAERHTENQD